ncbi:MAG TPA: aminotransferase class I/II-fold pyridoxal phosphate-dependent enzyme [Rhizomicrobium sp.]|nr:aminotransferase class I/II-fold pyridoxal phosphate-dependent enzyme [Rhizomicrobium sp.]
MSNLPPGPFARLATLLGDTKPGKEPISLAVGDPSGTVPDFVKDALAKGAAGFGNYPAIIGTEDWRQAAAGWLNRRFVLNGAIDAEKNLLPLNGTREGLFSVLFPLMPESKAGARPIVAMPNPFYQCYAAAALGSGAEPLYVAAKKENGFLPDFARLPEETLERLAAVYICSPSNPEGAVADEAYWTRLFRLAERYDFVVLADECYADIWFDKEPVCALTSRLAQRFDRLLSFHSLSKRSGLPGLRSGLVAGDAALVAKFRAFRNVAGPTVPTPLLAASAACWRDEAHVTANRAAYRERMDAAERILGNRMTRPGGGFFLWLDVGNGEDFALKAWREQGVRLLPGAYMGRDVFDGRAGGPSLTARVAGRSGHQEKTQSNPGFSYVRVALVNDLSTIMTALERLREIL